MVNPAAFKESTQLPSGAAVMYTSPSATKSVVKKVTLCNSDGAAGYYVTIYIVPFGGPTDATTFVINARAVGPGQTLDVTEMVNQVLEPGDFISAWANTAAKVNIRISGVTIA